MARALQIERAADEDLMVLIKGREYAAFAKLFNRHRPAAVSYAARMTGAPDAAERIVQEAFALVHSRAPKYKPKRPFRVWFFGILHELVFEHLSGRDTAPAATVERLAVLEPVSEEALSSPDAREAGRLYEELNRLKPIYREVVYLRVFEKMSYEEMAAVTGERLRTVRSRMDYAVEHLWAAAR